MPTNIDPPKRSSRTGTPASNVKRGEPGRRQGPGDATIKVKGQRATDRQRQIITDCLQEASRLGCSRRVMIAVVMAVTQESNAGLATGKTGNDDIGLFQQGREWISVANANDPAKATRAFLLGDAANVGGTGGVKGWKDRFGSLKNAPGTLNDAIKQVQISVGGYGPWEAEATATVDLFLGGRLGDIPGVERTYTVQYLFTRGSHQGTDETLESSWDAIGRLAEEVNFRRWAALNTLFYVSDEELIAAAPSVQITGDEGWLLAQPSYEWGADRVVSEMTLRVLTDRWGVLPGATVYMQGQGPLEGKWLVRSVRDDLWSPESDVTLTRPTGKRDEPRSETRTVQSDSTGDLGNPLLGTDAKDAASKLKDICAQISAQNRPYVYGGGHGKPLAQITASEGLDCSSSVSLALFAAGLFGDRTTAIVSGDFANSYGKAGKGDGFTIYANGEHVWIEFADGTRFDTSPQGDTSGSGPRLRTKPRNDQARFTARHYPGA